VSGAADPFLDEQAAAEIAELYVRLNERPKGQRLHEWDDLGAIFMRDFSVMVFAGVERMVLRWLMNPPKEKPPKRGRGRPRTRQRPTVLGGPPKRKRGRPPSDDTSLVREVDEQIAIAQEQGRRLRPGGGLCELIAASMKKMRPAKDTDQNKVTTS